jgi:hypothetical protein
MQYDVKPTCNIKQFVFDHKIISLQPTPTDFIIVSIQSMQIKYDIECKGNIFFEISKFYFIVKVSIVCCKLFKN